MLTKRRELREKFKHLMPWKGEKKNNLTDCTIMLLKNDGERKEREILIQN